MKAFPRPQPFFDSWSQPHPAASRQLKFKPAAGENDDAKPCAMRVSPDERLIFMDMQELLPLIDRKGMPSDSDMSALCLR